MLIAEPVSRAVRQAVPTFEPVSVAEAKKQCEIASGVRTHDDYFTELIAAAREQVEHDTGIVACTGSYVLKLDAWPDEDFISIVERPLSSITSIAYLDTDGASQTWASANYAVDAARNVIWRAYNVSWPDTRADRNAITITFVAGYATAAVVLERIKQAVQIRVYAEFTNRGGAEEQRTYDRLIAGLARHSYP